MLPNGTPVALTSGIHSILNNGNNSGNALNNSTNLNTINSACSLLSSNTFALQNSSLHSHPSGNQLKVDDCILPTPSSNSISISNNNNLAAGLGNTATVSNTNPTNHPANTNSLLNNAVMCAGGIGNLSQLSAIRHWMQPHSNPAIGLDITSSARFALFLFSSYSLIVI